MASQTRVFIRIPLGTCQNKDNWTPPSRVTDFLDLTWVSEILVSNKFPGNVDAVVLKTFANCPLAPPSHVNLLT